MRQANALFSEKKGFNPDSTRPIVYHLHGHRSVPESLVLTEDDYIDFLVRISGDSALLPPIIQSSLTNKMLLFVGYSLADWTFRVIFRGLLLSTRPPLATHAHVTRAWLALRRCIPWNCLSFLDDAHRRGVLRQDGPVYQFRTAALQHRLAHEPHPDQ